MSEFPPFPDGLLESAAELGAITDRSARIWLRVPGEPIITGTLQVDDECAVSAQVRLSEETDWTGSIEFELDSPAPRHSFTVDIAGRELHGRFAPSPGSRVGLTFAFGSCNEPFSNDDGEIIYHGSAPIYESLLHDIQRAECEFLLLGGDQIYSDLLDPLDVRQGLLDLDDDDDTRAEALKRYRTVTRGFFQARGFRELRDALPTYCIWDDHDIFDNWGSQQSESKMDRIMFEAASRAYCEYQHGRNPGAMIADPPYHYTFQYGDVGF
ncbi:MAG: alkaline phosphatase D family protein, partial [Chloroflexota bacterium]